MVLFSGLRWCSANTWCVVQLLSLSSIAYGLRTGNPREDLEKLRVFHPSLPLSAWMPVITSSAHRSFVGLRQTQTTGEVESLPDGTQEGAHYTRGAKKHKASSTDEKSGKTQTLFLQDSTEERVPAPTIHAEAPSDTQEEQSPLSNDDTVFGKGKTPQELTEDDLHRMTPREGLVALLSQGKDLVVDVQGTLDGIDAARSLGRVTRQIRDEIQKDVQALNRTIGEEFENIEQLRQLQEAQTAVLRSQLSFLMPKHAPPATAQGKIVDTTGHTEAVSGEMTSAALSHLWYMGLFTFLTMELGSSFM